jgi:hypothetical protein
VPPGRRASASLRQDSTRAGAGGSDPVAWLRHHCRHLPAMRDALADWFALGEPVRGSYLYRWDMPPGMRDVEERLIADGRLPAVGARMVGIRRPGPA